MARGRLAAEVDRLASEHEGEDFVAAVRRLAARLPDEERDELGRVLLERAPSTEWALSERYRAKGWLRRRWAALDPARARRAR